MIKDREAVKYKSSTTTKTTIILGQSTLLKKFPRTTTTTATLRRNTSHWVRASNRLTGCRNEIRKHSRQETVRVHRVSCTVHSRCTEMQPRGELALAELKAQGLGHKGVYARCWLLAEAKGPPPSARCTVSVQPLNLLLDCPCPERTCLQKIR